MGELRSWREEHNKKVLHTFATLPDNLPTMIVVAGVPGWPAGITGCPWRGPGGLAGHLRGRPGCYGTWA